MSSRSLHIHIDRLSVEGLRAQDQLTFVRALERQLTEMASGVLPKAFTAGSRSLAGFDAGRLHADATPEQAARQVTSALSATLAGKEPPHHG